MKKTLLTLCCALCLATCAMAQNGKNADGYQRQAHGSETVLFSWAGHEETPASQGDWRDKYNNIEKKLSQGARMHSLAEHPALQQAFVAKKTSQKNKTTKDDTGQMTVLGGFGPVSWTVLTNIPSLFKTLIGSATLLQLAESSFIAKHLLVMFLPMKMISMILHKEIMMQYILASSN